MKQIITFVLMAFAMYGNLIAQSGSFQSTQYFEFYSDYWISLHHFFYQMAEGGQDRHLEEDGMTLLDVGDKEIFKGLSQEDVDRYQKVVAYYKEYVIDRSLFRLGKERVWLQNQHPEKAITDTSLSKAFADILNMGSAVYRPHYWPIHEFQSTSVVELHFQMIQELEKRVVQRIVALSGSTWPKEKLRVDVTAYANYAGAYTPMRPEINIFISTLDPNALASSFIETVFHEGSHTLFSRENPFRSKIYSRSEEMGMEFPSGLWHASQFYLVGLIVKDEMAKKGFLHTLLMDEKKVFSNFDNLEFRIILDDYYSGKTELDPAIDRLLRNLE